MFFFLPQYQRQRIFFRARAKKGIARHIGASSVDLVIFDWFVMSIRMQVNLAFLDSLFARPSTAPSRGREEKRVQGLDYRWSGCDICFNDNCRNHIWGECRKARVLHTCFTQIIDNFMVGVRASDFCTD